MEWTAQQTCVQVPPMLVIVSKSIQSNMLPCSIKFSLTYLSPKQRVNMVMKERLFNVFSDY